MMSKFIFTFGGNHVDKNDQSLGNCFVEVVTKDERSARDAIFKVRGNRWSMVYGTEEEAGVARFELKRKTLADVTLFYH